jgi:(4-(4-[2-(gamma-L-glutamylamino)ethyl]phenoxymethyl)furan-2-yl)methanamine synthase
MVRMTVLGLDIGGANLKAAHTSGRAFSVPFALWKDPALLPDALRRLLHEMPPADRLAVTMTGELADCFESKRRGVLAILDAVVAVAGSTPVRVWCNDGHFVDVSVARTTPLQVASANWLALAVFAGRYATAGPALLIDIGSTTTDIVPLLDGRPVPKGRTDPERLRSGELVYTGVRRTPLCAVLGGHGAAEMFATTLDAYLLLGAIGEDPADINTADSRPATKAAAEKRVARMLCADLETSSANERRKLIERVLMRQVMMLGSSFKSVALRLPSLPQTVLLAGEGEFLAKIALQEQQDIPPCKAVLFSAELGPEMSRAACAYAVAVLAKEQG